MILRKDLVLFGNGEAKNFVAMSMRMVKHTWGEPPGYKKRKRVNFRLIFSCPQILRGRSMRQRIKEAFKKVSETCEFTI